MKHDYITYHCKRCSNLTDIYPQGIKIRRDHMEGGAVPCLCSKSPRLSVDQKFALCSRYCKGTPIKLIGYSVKDGVFTFEYFNTLYPSKSGNKKFNGEVSFHKFLENQLQLSTLEPFNFDFLPSGSYYYKSFPLAKNAIYYYRCGSCSVSSDEVFPLRHSNIQNKKLSCRCNPNYKPQEKERETLLVKYLSNKGATFIKWLGEDKTVKGHFEAVCQEGHSFINTYDMVKSKGRFCAKCSDYTFKEDKEDCIFYVNKFGKWGKFGITSRDFNTRFYEQCTANPDKGSNLYIYQGLGKSIKDLEDKVKSLFKYEEQATKEEMPDGYTESFILNARNLNRIYDIILTMEDINKVK